MTPNLTTPEQADQYWERMGEPPSSRAYLRTIYFDGQPVVVREPAGYPINQSDEE